MPNNLSFMDDLLPSKQDLDWRTKPFFSGGIMVVRRVGVGQDRHKNIDLVQAEEMFLSMLKFLCEIVSSFKVKGHVL